ncbi:MAG: hypothetical protein Q7R96_00695 [Nanoarchaeota archaeon]|nr:hypothetical protein [Nanoarchaeota archaeon]
MTSDSFPKGNIDDLLNNAYHTSIGMGRLSLELATDFCTLSFPERSSTNSPELDQHYHSCKPTCYGIAGSIIGGTTYLGILTLGIYGLIRLAN